MTYILDVAKGFHMTLRQMCLNNLKSISVQLGTCDRHIILVSLQIILGIHECQFRFALNFSNHFNSC